MTQRLGVGWLSVFRGFTGKLKVAGSYHGVSDFSGMVCSHWVINMDRSVNGCLWICALKTLRIIHFFAVN